MDAGTAAESGSDDDAGAAARRHFVVLCHKGRWDGNFPVDDLSQGRMDLKARCIQTALFYSYGVRKDSSVTLLDAETSRSLAVLGATAETMRPDERRIGELMQGALCTVPLPRGEDAPSGLDDAASDQPVSDHTAHSRQRQRKHDLKKFANLRKAWASKRCGADCGFVVTDGDSLESCIARRAPQGSDRVLVLLVVEDGVEWHDVQRRVQQAEQVVMVMGDNVGLLEAEDRTASSMGAVRVRLGSVPMLSSHCIVVMHHLIDQIKPPKNWAKLSDVRVHAVEGTKTVEQPQKKSPETGLEVPRPLTDLRPVRSLLGRLSFRILVALVITALIVVKLKSRKR